MNTVSSSLVYTGEENHNNTATTNTLEVLLDRKGVQDYLVSAVKATV